MLTDYSKILVSDCNKYHTLNKKPLYNKIFQSVLKFHQPGLAPVIDNTGAYHINITGDPIYKHRYLKTYGYYAGFSAVVDGIGWFHIDVEGKPLYQQKYLWCGNFQEGLCVVLTDAGYCHIDQSGSPCYPDKYQYAGDYKDQIAVVQQQNKYFHINTLGQKIHEYEYLFLDIFHKDYARAQDERGWFHVSTVGQPIYDDRYKYIEPFYNDIALVQSFNNDFYRINSEGTIVEKISSLPQDDCGDLSGKMVGFWQLFVINAAVEVNLLSYLPATSQMIAKRSCLSHSKTSRLLRGLWEVGIVNCVDDVWSLTQYGALLTPKKHSFMASASSMWVAVCRQWTNLINLLKINEEAYHPCFKDDVDLDQLTVYHHALQGYADKDFLSISNVLSINKLDNILVAGTCARAIIPNLLKIHKNIKITYADSEKRLRDFTLWPEFSPQVKIQTADLFQPWSNYYNLIIFPRYLHYWPDKDVNKLLAQAVNALLKNGKIIIMEMILCEHSPCGGLLDLNMMVETGGKLRTLNNWVYLMKQHNMCLHSKIVIHPYLSLLEFTYEAC